METIIRFGVFELALESRELRKQGLRIKLQPQPLEVLATLVEQPSRLVTRDELKTKIFSAGVTLNSDHSLNKAVNKLRVALGDQATTPRYIETLSKRGYRFITPISRELPRHSAERPNRIRLAVLPFRNLSDDPVRDYLSDGMTEEMISRLGHASPTQLNVIAHTSAMQYKHTSKAIREIGLELNVDYILEGSLRTAGQRAIVRVRLIDTRHEIQIWTRKQSSEINKIFDSQDRLIAQIARTLAVKLLPQQRSLPTNGAAQANYLAGRYLLHQLQEDKLYRALEHFQRAIELDSNFALAYTGLADAYSILGVGFGKLSPHECFPKAKEFTSKALAINDNLAEAHNSLAFVMHYYDWDWAGADREYRRAILLNPSYPMARWLYGEFLVCLEEFEKGFRELSLAIECDPVCVLPRSLLGMMLVMGRRYDEAIGVLQQSLNLSPQLETYVYLGSAYTENRMYDEAIRMLQHAKAIQPHFGLTLALLGRAYAVAGRTTEAVRMIEGLQDLSTKQYVPASDIAMVYAALGQKDNAFRYLEKAFKERTFHFIYMKVNPMWDPLRGDRRLDNLIRRTGLDRARSDIQLTNP